MSTLRGTRGYDSALQMYQFTANDPSPEWLGFLRWKAERGDYSNKPTSAPCGDYAPPAEEPDEVAET